LKLHFNIFLSLTPGVVKWSLSLSPFIIKSLYALFLSHKCYLPSFIWPLA
jgi:hypothetical protein